MSRRMYDFSQSDPAGLIVSEHDKERVDYGTVNPHGRSMSVDDVMESFSDVADDAFYCEDEQSDSENQPPIENKKFCDHLYDRNCQTCVENYGIRKRKLDEIVGEERYDEDDRGVHEKRTKWQ